MLSLLEELARKQEDVSLHPQPGPGASGNLGSRPSPDSDGAQQGSVISGTAGHLGMLMGLVTPWDAPAPALGQALSLEKLRRKGRTAWTWDLNPSSALHLLCELRPVR